MWDFFSWIFSRSDMSRMLIITKLGFLDFSDMPNFTVETSGIISGGMSASVGRCSYTAAAGTAAMRGVSHACYSVQNDYIVVTFPTTRSDHNSTVGLLCCTK